MSLAALLPLVVIAAALASSEIELVHDKLIESAKVGDVFAMHDIVVRVAAETAMEGDDQDAEARRLADAADGVVDEHGRSPLHVAAIEGHLKAVKYLLARGASVNTVDDSGDTPLHSCIRERQSAMARPLVLNGAAVDTINEQTQETPLAIAASLGDVPTAELLLGKGASVSDDVVAMLQGSPLCTAASRRRYHLVRKACGLRVGRHPAKWRAPDGNDSPADEGTPSPPTPNQ